MDFHDDEKATIVQSIKQYFADELNQEIGQIDAELLLDFFSEKVGGAYYNLGLRDARAVLAAKLADVDDALYEIEQTAPALSGR